MLVDAQVLPRFTVSVITPPTPPSADARKSLKRAFYVLLTIPGKNSNIAF